MSKQPKANKILYVKLASLSDLARYVCNFDYTASSIISIRKQKGYVLVAFGEDLDGSMLAYYINTPESEGMICYTYPSSGEVSENAHFVKEPGSPPNQYMNILEVDGKNIKEAKKSKPIQMVQVKDYEELIIAVIKGGMAHNSLPHLYSFSKSGKTVFCAFDIIEELSDGPRTLYYSVTDGNLNASFARYKYIDNKVDFTTYMGEHSYMYAKIINLAEQFPFFKMPD